MSADLLDAPVAPAAPSTSARLEPCTDESAWDRAARTLPGGTAFHDWGFLDLQERLSGIVIERHVLLVDGEPAGIVPVARRSARSPRSPWIEFPFLGPAVPERHAADALRAYRAHQRRTGLLLGHFDVAPALTAATADAASSGPMRARLDGTVQIDLAHGSAAAVDARMAKARRRAIRQALEAGVAARAARPGELARVLGPALAAAYARQGARSPYPLDIGAVVEAWAQDRPDVLLSVATIDDEVVAANVTLGAHATAVAWIGARVDGAEARNAEAVLLRFVLLRAMAAGHTALDLAGRVNDDVERFKRSLGGEAVPYLVVESVLGPVRALHLLRRALARG